MRGANRAARLCGIGVVEWVMSATDGGKGSCGEQPGETRVTARISSHDRLRRRRRLALAHIGTRRGRDEPELASHLRIEEGGLERVV
jgi:hypothetical protein